MSWDAYDERNVTTIPALLSKIFNWLNSENKPRLNQREGIKEDKITLNYAKAVLLYAQSIVYSHFKAEELRRIHEEFGHLRY